MKAATTSRGPATGSTLSPASAGGSTRAANAAAGDAASLEARVAAFKADPALMEVATRFVAEVLERAKEEASKRLRERDAAAPQEASASDVARGGQRMRGLRGRSARWGARAQNFLLRIFASLCLCNSTGTGAAGVGGVGGVVGVGSGGSGGGDAKGS